MTPLYVATLPFGFSLNGDGFCRFYRIIRKQRKNPVAKYYLQWCLNPVPLPFQPCILLAELIPNLFVSLRHLDPHIVMLF